MLGLSANLRYFLCCSTIDILYWDGDGFALFYKRLERVRYSHTAHKTL
ncbi:MAG: IS66 family insertion sequence element accessory protein TnpB [Salinivirgaceae bacterium]|nr:IS66 family insertion sequence element accessory protein TnpB [Salinivirgaceae bacterium]